MGCRRAATFAWVGLAAALPALAQGPGGSGLPAFPGPRGPAPDGLHAFPAAGPLRPDRVVRLGGLRLESVSFEPLPGWSEAGNTRWCGLRLRAGGGAEQRIVAVGEGRTETVSCDGLAEAGALPVVAGVRRVGLVYRTHTRNAWDVRTPVVLALGAGGWAAEDALGDAVDAGRGRASLARMRRELPRLLRRAAAR